MSALKPYSLSAEDIAYWYLRLNGFLLLRNFLIHGDHANPRGEIDLVGVRFRGRSEHLAKPMADDAWMTQIDRSILVFCEVKRGAGQFNQSWRNPASKILESLLAAVGMVPKEQWAQVAAELYTHGFSKRTPELLVTALLISGAARDPADKAWQGVPHISLTDTLGFIYNRFTKYRSIKLDHSQWELSGQRLWHLFEMAKNGHAFIEAAMKDVG